MKPGHILTPAILLWLVCAMQAPATVEHQEVIRNRLIVERIESATTASDILDGLREGWNNPPATYRPHTRWWWPGNAVTREGIAWQLEEMKAKGFGGTEPMSWLKVYDKGNIEFETQEFIEMMRFAVEKSHELGMFITPPLFPGWGHGGARVPPEHRAKALVISASEVEGGSQTLRVPLPREGQLPHLEWNAYMENQPKRFDALVAMALDADGNPVPTRLIDLTASVDGERGFAVRPRLTLNAELPEGRWKLMVFWTCFTNQKCASENNVPRSYIVDHLSRDAVQSYLDHSGGRYVEAFGEHFGQTIDSFFGDSYEVRQDFSYWSDHLFERFQRIKGYDLRPYLPMLVYDGAPETPYVRYDFGHFLHLMGMEGITQTLTDYCESLGIDMRQQPHYRFTTELIEASGTFHRPETENTRRSFDPVIWHKLTTSGAKLYPSDRERWVSAEAFTFINENYRASMEQIKRATDLFIRDGVTQFYNHGYFYTPEKEVCPSRDLIFMERISHVNTWWPWYRGLADYQSRAAFLARQGREMADVLVYSPMPTLWSERAQFPVRHIRDLPFGPLPKILVANGYDFDCVNDDLLVNHASIKQGQLRINGYDYRVLILPRAICLSPDTLEVVEHFVRSGGTVIALAELPRIAPGMVDREQREERLASVVDRLFATGGGSRRAGKGTTWFFPNVEGLEYLTDWRPQSVEWEPTAPLSQAWSKAIDALRAHLVPDFEIADRNQSQGLTFRRSVIGPVECWFVTNLQPNSRQTEVTLKTDGGIPRFWDAMTGDVTTPDNWRYASDGRLIVSVSLEPWASIFIMVEPGRAIPDAASPVRQASTTLAVEGPWQVSFAGLGGVTGDDEMEKLLDWTRMPEWKDFSGEATYTAMLFIPEMVAASGKCVIDLGIVHDVAQVRINGRDAGKVWMQPYRVDVTGLLEPGENVIEVTVANLLYNHCAGLEEPKPIPTELHEHYGDTWRADYMGWDRMQLRKSIFGHNRMPSGLLGPVTLTTYR